MASRSLRAPSRGRFGHLRVALSTLLAAALVLGGTSAGAFAAESGAPSPTAVSSTGSISGTVTDAATGAPIADATVVVLAADGAATSQATTTTSGGYTVAELPAGDFYVSVTAASGYDAGFFPAASTLADAQTVALTDAETRVGIDVTLAATVAATIAQSREIETEDDTAAARVGDVSLLEAPATFTVSGRVTDGAGAALSGVSVSVYGDNGYFTAQSDSTGAYTITAVPAGSYIGQFWKQGYAAQYFDRAEEYSQATPLIVTKNESGIDAALRRNGTISGTVVDGNGAAVIAPRIAVYSAATHEIVTMWWEITGGTYSVDVAPGTYLVAAMAGSLDVWADTYYGGTTDIAQATTITVAEGGAATGRDIRLIEGYTISGKVLPVGVGAGISVESASGTAVYRASGVAPDGSYVVKGLGVGEYIVSAYKSNGLGGNDFIGYYDDAYTFGSATPVAVTTGNVSGIDITVVGTGAVTGDVGAAASVPGYENTLITAYRWNGQRWDETLSTSGWGQYALGLGISGFSQQPMDLPAGVYTVGFSDPGASWDHEGEWDYPYCTQFYNGTKTIENADRFDVTARTITDGINAALTLKSEGCGATQVITPGDVSISGTPQVGQTLTAVPGTWAPEQVELDYQWLLDDHVIVGADAPTFTPQTVHLGGNISVIVTGSRPGLASVSAASDQVGPVTAAGPQPPSVSVTNAAPKAGSAISITGTGFGSGEVVRLELHSTPVELATITAGEDGAFSAQVTIPADTSTGAHTIFAIGSSERRATVPITVAAADSGSGSGTGSGTASGSGAKPAAGLPVTGSSLPIGMGLAAMALMLAGAAVFAASRARRTV